MSNDLIQVTVGVGKRKLNCFKTVITWFAKETMRVTGEVCERTRNLIEIVDGECELGFWCSGRIFEASKHSGAE